MAATIKNCAVLLAPPAHTALYYLQLAALKPFHALIQMTLIPVYARYRLILYRQTKHFGACLLT